MGGGLRGGADLKIYTVLHGYDLCKHMPAFNDVITYRRLRRIRNNYLTRGEVFVWTQLRFVTPHA